MRQETGFVLDLVALGFCSREKPHLGDAQMFLHGRCRTLSIPLLELFNNGSMLLYGFLRTTLEKIYYGGHPITKIPDILKGVCYVSILC